MNSTHSYVRLFWHTAALCLASSVLWACATPDGAPPPAEPEGRFCTMDVVQCSNGDWVGRRPPGCQFTCPAGSQPVAPQR